MHLYLSQLQELIKKSNLNKIISYMETVISNTKIFMLKYAQIFKKEDIIQFLLTIKTINMIKIDYDHNKELFLLIKNGNLTDVKEYIIKIINLFKSYGLLFACNYDKVEIARYFITNDADINSIDNFGYMWIDPMNCLEIVALNSKKNATEKGNGYRLIKMLLENDILIKTPVKFNYYHRDTMILLEKYNIKYTLLKRIK